MFLKRAILVSLFLAGTALAKSLEVNYIGAGAPATTQAGIPEYITYLFTLSLTVGAFLSLGIIMIAGFKYLTSIGNPAILEEAKDQIFSAILGLLILLSSWLILNAVNPALTKSELNIENAPTPDPVKIIKAEGPAASTYVVIPVGQIIEQAVYSRDSLATYAATVDKAQETIDLLKQLKSLGQELKNLTDACACGYSSCSGCSNTNANCCYGGNPQCVQRPHCVPQDCKVSGCPGAFCDKAAIKRKGKEITDHIEIIRQQQTELSLLATVGATSTITKKPNDDGVENAYLHLQKAGLLMSMALHKDVPDYYSFLSERENLKNIEMETLPEWRDFWERDPSDPLTFYIDKEENKDILEMASQIEIITSPSEGVMAALDDDTVFDSPPTAPLASGKVQNGQIPNDQGLNVVFYYQNRGKWANDLMGTPSCGDKIKRWGCGITSISMVLNYFGIGKDPGQTLKYLDSNEAILHSKCYLNGGMTLNKISPALNKLGLTTEKLYKNLSYMQNNYLSKGIPVVSRCLTYRCPTCKHFVVLRGYKDGKVYLNDPTWGDTIITENTYNHYQCGQYYYALYK